MKKDQTSLKERALRAARAVTLSAAFAGAVACAEDDPDTNGWDVGNGSDTGDVEDDDTADTVQNDTAEQCSGESDNTCPEACTMNDDVDCCDDFGGIWEEWEGGQGCAIPGPFVPPEMRA